MPSITSHLTKIVSWLGYHKAYQKPQRLFLGGILIAKGAKKSIMQDFRRKLIGKLIVFDHYPRRSSVTLLAIGGDAGISLPCLVDPVAGLRARDDQCQRQSSPPTDNGCTVTAKQIEAMLIKEIQSDFFALQDALVTA